MADPRLPARGDRSLPGRLLAPRGADPGHAHVASSRRRPARHDPGDGSPAHPVRGLDSVVGPGRGRLPVDPVQPATRGLPRPRLGYVRGPRSRRPGARTDHELMAMRGAIFVLAAGFLALLFNGGSRFTMGLMLKPMADDLDWGRTTLSLAVTFFMIVSALALPVAGRLVDRFNTWTVLATAMLAAGASIALMRFI